MGKDQSVHREIKVKIPQVRLHIIDSSNIPSEYKVDPRTPKSIIRSIEKRLDSKLSPLSYREISCFIPILGVTTECMRKVRKWNYSVYKLIFKILSRYVDMVGLQNYDYETFLDFYNGWLDVDDENDYGISEYELKLAKTFFKNIDVNPISKKEIIEAYNSINLDEFSEKDYQRMLYLKRSLYFLYYTEFIIGMNLQYFRNEYSVNDQIYEGFSVGLNDQDGIFNGWNYNESFYAFENYYNMRGKDYSELIQSINYLSSFCYMMTQFFNTF